MFKLLNRFAWLLAIFWWLSSSFIFDRNWPFDEEWFWTFIIITIIIKFFLLSKSFIEDRVTFFANAIKKELPKTNIETWTKKEINIENLPQTNTNEQIKNNTNKEWKYSFPTDKEFEIEEETTKEIPLTSKIIEKKEIISEPSKFALFFSENVIAKIWWILIFLATLYILKDQFDNLWAIWKLIIWFSIWFIIYFVWVWLDKKNFKTESRVLLGIWILINFLVILSGRYLLWDEEFLSSWITFFFLILNTIFAIVTSFVYKSNTLLLFSFIFAYINPFLIGSNDNTPYILLGYSLIVSIWALILANSKTMWSFNNILLYTAIIWWSILTISWPVNIEAHFIFKIICFAVLFLPSIFTAYRINKDSDSSHLIKIFLIWYWVFSLLLTSNNFWGLLPYISYMTMIFIMIGINITLFIKTSVNSIISIIFTPLLIITWLLFTWTLYFAIQTISIIVLLYLFIFIYLSWTLINNFKYVFFIILWIFVFLSNSFLGFSNFELWNIAVTNLEFLTIMISSMLFLWTSYYFSSKNWNEYLYTIWTIWTILSISPILVFNNNNWYLLEYSVIWVSIFAILNSILPFINKILISSWKSLNNIIVSIVSWLLFIVYVIYRYSELYFPWIAFWFTLILLAIVYFILAYLMFNKLSVTLNNTDENKASSKNLLLTYLWVSISIFSLAMVYIFAWKNEAVSTIWLFEASILFYFFSKSKEFKIYIGWIILFFIWIINLFYLTDNTHTKDYFLLFPISIIITSFVLNIKFLINDIKKNYIVIHDILHILWIIILWTLLYKIIPSTWHWWSLLWISSATLLITLIYSKIWSKTLKWFWIISVIWAWISQIWDTNYLFYKLEKDWLEQLKILWYITSTIIIYSSRIWYKSKENLLITRLSQTLWSLFFFIITTIFVYDLINSIYIISLYWWLLSFTILNKWISWNIIKFRTIWLYILSLTIAKIALYDIWQWFSDNTMRAWALMAIWILMLLISWMYSKKYGWNFKWEMSFNNLFEKNSEKNRS